MVIWVLNPTWSKNFLSIIQPIMGKTKLDWVYMETGMFGSGLGVTQIWSIKKKSGGIRRKLKRGTPNYLIIY